jgi:hypothetical protein
MSSEGIDDLRNEETKNLRNVEEKKNLKSVSMSSSYLLRFSVS